MIAVLASGSLGPAFKLRLCSMCLSTGTPYPLAEQVQVDGSDPPITGMPVNVTAMMGDNAGPGRSGCTSPGYLLRRPGRWAWATQAQ